MSGDTNEKRRGAPIPKFDAVVGPDGVADYLRAKRDTLESIVARRSQRRAKEEGRVALSQTIEIKPET